mmetsp:Transcript_10344/g.31771  ORF Transcript_10344/g.31771 Transcript_10344/m.31771 type:complete len:405 (-) Transcript_10344:1683-2897(-)
MQSPSVRSTHGVGSSLKRVMTATSSRFVGSSRRRRTWCTSSAHEVPQRSTSPRVTAIRMPSWLCSPRAQMRVSATRTTTRRAKRRASSSTRGLSRCSRRRRRASPCRRVSPATSGSVRRSRSGPTRQPPRCSSTRLHHPPKPTCRPTILSTLCRPRRRPSRRKLSSPKWSSSGIVACQSQSSSSPTSIAHGRRATPIGSAAPPALPSGIGRGLCEGRTHARRRSPSAGTSRARSSSLMRKCHHSTRRSGGTMAPSACATIRAPSTAPLCASPRRRNGLLPIPSSRAMSSTWASTRSRSRRLAPTGKSARYWFVSFRRTRSLNRKPRGTRSRDWGARQSVERATTTYHSRTKKSRRAMPRCGGWAMRPTQHSTAAPQAGSHRTSALPMGRASAFRRSASPRARSR